MASDTDFAYAVADMQAKGFAGMFTGRTYTKRQAARMERAGLLISSWMDVADGDGYHREGCRQRRGYSVTEAGLSLIPDDERWWVTGSVLTAEDAAATEGSATDGE